MQSRLFRMLFWMCLSVVIITPFSVDIFIPAFPEMQVLFDTDHITLVISIYLAGMGLAQPLYGPLSDRFGRKPVLLAGLIIYLLGSSINLVAPNFIYLLIARFIQAVGACSTIVSAMAMLRDTQKEGRLVQSMGVLMAIIGVCPAMAPLLGSFLTGWLGWKGGFIFLWLLGLIYLAIITFLYRETNLQKNMQALAWNKMRDNYVQLFKNTNFAAYCLVSGLSYGTLFTFLSVASIYIIGLFHFSLISFGLMIFVNGLIILCTSLSIPKLSQRWGLGRICLLGTMVLLGGAVLMVLANLFWGKNIYTFVLPMAIVTLGIGMIRPMASAGAMAQAPQSLAGTAAAGFNFVSYVGGAICSTCAGFQVTSPLYFALFATLLGFLAWQVASWRQRRESSLGGSFGVG